MKGFFINPIDKTIAEFDSAEPTALIGCAMVAIAAILQSGDVLYTDDTQHSEALSHPEAVRSTKGFYVADLGYFFGKAVVVGHDSSGRIVDAQLSLEELKSSVGFEQDPFITSYETFLTQNNHSLESSIDIDGKMVPTRYILNVLSLLPEGKRTEILMMAQIDIGNGLEPTVLLGSFAKHLGENRK